jgi:hypothetical protein
MWQLDAALALGAPEPVEPGPGHLYHPDVYTTVQAFIGANKSDFSLKWLGQYRDCKVM